MEKWVGKEVLYFKDKEYYGFVPVEQGVITMETEDECLVEFKRLFLNKSKWCKKNSNGKAINISVSSACGYVKLIEK